ASPVFLLDRRSGNTRCVYVLILARRSTYIFIQPVLGRISHESRAQTRAESTAADAQRPKSQRQCRTALCQTTGQTWVTPRAHLLPHQTPAPAPPAPACPEPAGADSAGRAAPRGRNSIV